MIRRYSTMSELTACVQVFAVTELQDLIVDFVEKGRALHTCSLVCKSWSISAARHLFSILTVNALALESYPDADEVSASTGDTSSINTLTHSPRLECFGLESSPRIRNSVRSLVLKPFRRAKATHSLKSLPIQQLQLIIELFPLLQGLALHVELDLSAVTSARPFSSLGIIKQLGRVEIWSLCGVVNHPGTDACDVVRVFTQVDKLTYQLMPKVLRSGSEGGVPVTQADNSEPGRHCVKVDELTFVWYGFTNKLWSVGRSIDTSKLRTLRLRIYSLLKYLGVSVDMFLSNYAASIEAFEIQALSPYAINSAGTLEQSQCTVFGSEYN